MAKYEITDNKTGKTVVVEGSRPPTTTDAEAIFQKAGLRQTSPEPEKGLASKVTDFLIPRTKEYLGKEMSNPKTLSNSSLGEVAYESIPVLNLLTNLENGKIKLDKQGLGTAGEVASFMIPANKLLKGAGAGQKILGGALQGAEIGAVSGITDPTADTLKQRIEKGVTSGLVGGVTGGAVQGLFEVGKTGVKALVGNAAEKINKIIRPNPSALDKFKKNTGLNYSEEIVKRDAKNIEGMGYSELQDYFKSKFQDASGKVDDALSQFDAKNSSSNVANAGVYDAPLYHGTAKGNSFTQYDPKMAGRGVGTNSINQGNRLYLAEDKSVADIFSTIANDKKVLMDKNNNISNMGDLTGQSGDILNFKLKPNSKVKTVPYESVSSPQATDSIIQKAISEGYDAIRFEDKVWKTWDGYGATKINNYYKENGHYPYTVIPAKESSVIPNVAQQPISDKAISKSWLKQQFTDVFDIYKDRPSTSKRIGQDFETYSQYIDQLPENIPLSVANQLKRDLQELASAAYGNTSNSVPKAYQKVAARLNKKITEIFPQAKELNKETQLYKLVSDAVSRTGSREQNKISTTFVDKLLQSVPTTGGALATVATGNPLVGLGTLLAGAGASKGREIYRSPEVQTRLASMISKGVSPSLKALERALENTARKGGAILSTK